MNEKPQNNQLPPAQRSFFFSWDFYSKEEAEKFLKQTSYALFSLAVLQGLILYLLFQSGLLDSVIYLVLGFLIGKKSRVGAILFFVVSLVVLFSTLGASIGLIEGGRNMYLSIFLVWLAARSIKATQEIRSEKFNVPLTAKAATKAEDKWVTNLEGKLAARAREPGWIKLFSAVTMFASVGITGYLIFQSGKAFKSLVRPDMLYGSNLPMSNGYSVISFASMLVAIPLGLMLANIIFWIIPPVRKAMNKTSEGVPGASFKEGMAGLKRISIVVVPLMVITIILFAFEPWTP